MAKKIKKEDKEKSGDDTKLFAFLATFLTVIGFIIALLAKREDKYVMHYAKQSLVVFVVFIIAGVVMIVPVIGWLIGPIIYVIAVLLWLISWIYALSGKVKEVPLVGKYARKINL